MLNENFQIFLFLFLKKNYLQILLTNPHSLNTNCAEYFYRRNRYFRTRFTLKNHELILVQ